jgi:hypothetical protein
MLVFENIDLASDPAVRQYVKDEIVLVTFATADDAVISREGLNRFSAGDAIITGSTGDRWSVTRERFERKYQPVAPLLYGCDGRYRSKPIPVRAKQVHEPFTVKRTANGDVLRGAAGDWLMQYAPGDYGIVENAKFQQVYRGYAGGDRKEG